MAEREVDDVDAEPNPIRYRELDRLHHGARRTDAVRVEDLEADQPDLGRDASIQTVRQRAVAADQAADVRPVPVVVVGLPVHATLREIDEDDAAEVGVQADTGIADRDADAFA